MMRQGPMEQLLVFALVAGAAYYLLQRLWSRSDAGCGGCGGCAAPADADPEPAELVQIEGARRPPADLR
jgi:hypothetical protein